MQPFLFTEAELTKLLKLDSAQVERVRDSAELTRYTSGLERVYSLLEVKRLLASELAVTQSS